MKSIWTISTCKNIAHASYKVYMTRKSMSKTFSQVYVLIFIIFKEILGISMKILFHKALIVSMNSTGSTFYYWKPYANHKLQKSPKKSSKNLCLASQPQPKCLRSCLLAPATVRARWVSTLWQPNRLPIAGRRQCRQSTGASPIPIPGFLPFARGSME